MIPTELVYLAIAAAIGVVLVRYFTGRGGVEIVRGDYTGLPAEGRVEVRRHLVRWRAEVDDAFVAGWQVAGGQVVVLRVGFDAAAEDEPDLGNLEISIGRRHVVGGVGWTEKIRDRALRADVEAVLKALAREARVARSDAARAAAARPVGDERDDRQEDRQV